MRTSAASLHCMRKVQPMINLYLQIEHDLCFKLIQLKQYQQNLQSKIKSSICLTHAVNRWAYRTLCIQYQSHSQKQCKNESGVENETVYVGLTKIKRSFYLISSLKCSAFRIPQIRRAENYDMHNPTSAMYNMCHSHIIPFCFQTMCHIMFCVHTRRARKATAIATNETYWSQPHRL